MATAMTLKMPYKFIAGKNAKVLQVFLKDGNIGYIKSGHLKLPAFEFDGIQARRVHPSVKELFRDPTTWSEV